jgi:hypothetical protein
MVAAIEKAVPEIQGRITFEDVPLPNADSIDDSEFQKALGPVDYRLLDEGVRQSVEHFRRALEEGKLNVV